MTPIISLRAFRTPAENAAVAKRLLALRVGRWSAAYYDYLLRDPVQGRIYRGGIVESFVWSDEPESRGFW